jgi:hypothetical protein
VWYTHYFLKKIQNEGTIAIIEDFVLATANSSYTVIPKDILIDLLEFV